MRASIAVIVVGLWAGTARAQSGGETKAAADAAFEKGKQLKDAGKCDEAIEHFAKSQQLDPQLGTQYNLALCYEQVGRIASAWGEYNELAAKDTNKKRKADSAKRAKAIAPKLTRMTITVAAPVDGLVVTRDGVDVTALIDVETPVDPGVAEFAATAPGYGAWHEEIDLTTPGATVPVEVPPLDKLEEDTHEPDPDGGTGKPDGGERKLPPPPPPAASDPGKLRKLVGLSMAGAGVVAAGVGLFFGFQAKGLTDDAKETCGGALDPCTGNVAAAQAQIDDANSKAMLSNIFVGAGLAVAIVGVVVWVTAPSAPAAEASAFHPVVSADGFGLAYDGVVVMRAAVVALLAFALPLGGCQLVLGIEDPVGDECSPFEVDTCDLSDTCDIDEAEGRLTCRLAGTVAAGGLCFEPDDCAGPLSCIAGVCRTFCPVFGDACADPAEAECLVQWYSSQVCDSACDVLAGTCQNGETECILSTNANGTPIALCVPQGYFGDKAEGESCGSLEECAPTLSCDTQGDGTCRKLCMNGDTCPNGPCVARFDTLHGVQTGLCPP